jgi:hypothetical protein
VLRVGVGVKHAVARVVAHSSYITLIDIFVVYDLDLGVDWD